MKKLLVILMVTVAMVCFCSCSVEMVGGPEETVDAEKQENTVKEHTGAVGDIVLALVLDEAAPGDELHAVRIWNGISKFSEENDLTCAYYSPSALTTEARIEAVTQAVMAGAQIVFCYGEAYEPVIYETQNTCPTTAFVLYDGEPRAADYSDYQIKENVEAIVFAEQEMGYLVGYAAVEEGYTELAFMAGLPVDSVLRYGGGFLQGVHDAAKATGKTAKVTYSYSGLAAADDSLTSLAGNLYLNNVQAIFTCDEDYVANIASAAEAAGHKVIGVGPYGYQISETVLSCVEKEYTAVTYQILQNYYGDMFRGGQVITLNTADGAIGLELENSRFALFTKEQYDSLITSISRGNIRIQSISDPTYDLSAMYASENNSVVEITVLE